MRPRRLAVVIAIGMVSVGSSLLVLEARMARRAGPQGRGGTGTVILEQAPTDRSVRIPVETLRGYYRDMDARALQTLRMLEGVKFNVNIRRITNAETALVHPNTIDLWVVTEGAGMLTTGGKIEGGRIVGGQSHPLKPGDVEFIPAGVPHGVSGVQGSITWLNIRWDTDWASKTAADQ
jgi:mannose-6-phosphate isomerase-like protein (cupin superfamily)